MIYLLAHIDYVNWSNVYTWLLSQYKMPETKKHFLINSFSCTAFYVSPAEWKWMTCPFLLLPNSFLWYHGKYFYAERTPPNSPLVHIKSKWKKKMASVGEVGGFWWREMIDRDIYVCVKQKWNKKKWNIYAVVLNVYCFLSSTSLRLLHLINFNSSGKWIFETLMHSNSCSHALNHL